MSNIDKFIWLNTIIAIVGTYLNAKGIRLGFIIWMATNAVFTAYNFYLGAYPQVALFTVYFGLAFFGFLSWGKAAKKQKKKQLKLLKKLLLKIFMYLEIIYYFRIHVCIV